MKTNLLITTTLITLLFGCSPTSKIIGTWNITSLENNKTLKNESDNSENTPSYDSKKYIIFSKDRTMEGGDKPYPPNKKGTWQYLKKEKKLTIASEERNSHDLGDYKVLKLSRNKMTLRKDHMQVTLTKSRKELIFKPRPKAQKMKSN